MNVKQISVFLENKPGALNAMTEVLAQHGIDIRALYLAETTDFGIARIIVADSYNATVTLKDAGYVCTITPVLGVMIPDTAGGLNEVLKYLNTANINIEYMYAFMGKKNPEHAYVVFRVTDNAIATEALSAHGIRIITQESICNL